MPRALPPALVAAAPPVPLLAAVTGVLVYVYLRVHCSSFTPGLWWSLVLGGAIWLGAAMLQWPRQRLATSNPRLFAILRNQVISLEGALARLEVGLPGSPTEAVDRARLHLLRSEVALLADELGFDGRARAARGVRSSVDDWTSESGYTAFFQRLHAIEVGKLLVLQRDELVGFALELHLRLIDSPLEKVNGTLSYQLESALASLGVQEPRRVLERGEPPQAATAHRWQAATPAAVEQARFLLRTVAWTVISYRDGLYAALVAQRQQASLSVFVTGVILYGFVATMILAHVPSAQLLSGALLFGAGALTGIVSRSTRAEQLSVEDFNLNRIRMIQAVQFSGVAGVLGVLITVYGSALVSQFAGPASMLPATLAPARIEAPATSSGVGVPRQPATEEAAAPGPSYVQFIPPLPEACGEPTFAASDQSGVLVPLPNVFNVITFPIGLLIALAFGAAPIGLLNRLEAVAEQLKANIKSTEAS